MINKYSNEYNHIKNPNWQEANQLAIYKRSQEVELGATENNISYWSERDLNPRPTDFKSGHASSYKEILKCRAVVVIVSVRQRSKGRIFVASTIYIWRYQNSVFNLPQNFISQNRRRNIVLLI